MKTKTHTHTHHPRELLLSSWRRKAERERESEYFPKSVIYLDDKSDYSHLVQQCPRSSIVATLSALMSFPLSVELIPAADIY